MSKSDELCIKNEEFCIYIDEFCRASRICPVLGDRWVDRGRHVGESEGTHPRPPGLPKESWFNYCEYLLWGTFVYNLDLIITWKMGNSTNVPRSRYLPLFLPPGGGPGSDLC